MPRLYVSSVVGNGTRLDPFRPRVFDLPTVSAQVIELPSNAAGAPLKNWVLVVANALDYAPLDADPDLTLLADQVDLDTTITVAVRNRINSVLSRLGIVARAVTGETIRVLANRLLAELGSSVVL